MVKQEEPFSAYNEKIRDFVPSKNFLFRGGVEDGKVRVLPAETIVVDIVANGVRVCTYELLGVDDSGRSVLAPTEEIRE